jgi:hypothetical protein
MSLASQACEIRAWVWGSFAIAPHLLLPAHRHAELKHDSSIQRKRSRR